MAVAAGGTSSVLFLLVVAVYLWRTATAAPIKGNLDDCPDAWLGDGTCQLACASERHRWDGGDCIHVLSNGDICEKRLGLGFLRDVHGDQQDVCSGTQSSVKGYFGLEPNDCGWPGKPGVDRHMLAAQLHNVQLRWANGKYEFRVHCEPTGVQFRNELMGVPDIGGILRMERETPGAGHDECTDWVEEPTIMVINPRNEYLHNMYHATEEFFALLQTAFVRDLPLRGMRFVIATTSVGGTLVQMASQLVPDSGLPVHAYDSPQLRAVFSYADGTRELIRSRVLKFLDALFRTPDDMPRMKPLNEAHLSSGKAMCFRHLIMPMRACMGSILTASFFPDGGLGCRGPNKISLGVRHAILGSYHDLLPEPAQSCTLHITIVHRRGTREQSNTDAMSDALKRQIPNTEVRIIEMENLDVKEQLQLLVATDLLITTHGAALATLVFLPPHAGVLELTDNPPPVVSLKRKRK